LPIHKQLLNGLPLGNAGRSLLRIDHADAPKKHANKKAMLLPAPPHAAAVAAAVAAAA
jgi:hypothetical protein